MTNGQHPQLEQLSLLYQKIMEKPVCCCQIYLVSYSFAQVLSKSFSIISLLLTLLPVLIHVQNPIFSTLTYSFLNIYNSRKRQYKSLLYLYGWTELSFRNFFLLINNYKYIYMYTSKDFLWKAKTSLSFLTDSCYLLELFWEMTG